MNGKTHAMTTGDNKHHRVEVVTGRKEHTPGGTIFFKNLQFGMKVLILVLQPVKFMIT